MTSIDSGYTDLGRALRWVEGEDARTWLQGQITCDVGTSAPGTSRYGLIVNLQGRVECDLWVLDEGDRLGLLLPAASVDALEARLERYIIMEDVEIEEDARAAFAIFGAPPSGLQTWPLDHLGAAHLVLLDDPAPLSALAEVAEDQLRAASIARCEPRFGPDFGPDLEPGTLPQEAGLAARAVAFDKGCYIGQEPVVMLEHRGKPPRVLVRFRLDTDLVLPPRAEVMSGERVIGHVTSSAPGAGFALLKRKPLERADGIHAQGHALTLDPCPR